jgi:hypothetical protein
MDITYNNTSLTFIAMRAKTAKLRTAAAAAFFAVAMDFEFNGLIMGK